MEDKSQAHFILYKINQSMHGVTRDALTPSTKVVLEYITRVRSIALKNMITVGDSMACESCTLWGRVGGMYS